MRIRIDCLKRFTVTTGVILGIILYGHSSYSQTKYFQLKGKVKGLDTGSIKINFLLTDPAKRRSYTAKISKGQFKIRGRILHPMRGYLVLNGSLVSDDFLLESGKQNIYVDATTKEKFYQSMKITGSEANDEFINSYEKRLQPLYEELDSCYDVLDSLNKLFTYEKPTSVYAAPCRNFQETVRTIDSVKKAYIIGHPSSYVSLWGLYTSIWSIDNLEFVDETFQYLDNKIKNSDLGKWLSGRLDVQKAFLNERRFPSMEVVDANNEKIATPEIINGRYTLVEFWFSHCRPCIAQFPALLNLYSKYNKNGFDVIGISIDKKVDRQDWVEAIAKHKLIWRQYWDIDGKETDKFFIDSYPTNFLLNGDGKIIKKNILPEELELFLTNNLK